ncbi:hypothetical protein D305_gp54 [Pseudomonas phage UFV-P2]|uniref:Uncharacterized protein n=1 Tax=Pseudomonas phage UFV-P2 TaxID=1235661 RepID=M4T233_9CAUD|nr:hypothetical protein D305_gp54 [Pseudomonas phage UFV-P2]AGH62731.1 hypothetical protein [Pseudomonas phage UFV-P2]
MMEPRYITVDARKLTQDQTEALFDAIPEGTLVTGDYVLVREKWSKDFYDEVCERVVKL